MRPPAAAAPRQAAAAAGALDAVASRLASTHLDGRGAAAAAPAPAISGAAPAAGEPPASTSGRPPSTGRVSGGGGGAASAAASPAAAGGGIVINSLDEVEAVGLIGSGSSGVVRRVRLRAGGAPLVLKAIPFDVQSDVLRKQVANELRTLYGASHEHIVRCVWL
jgi:hypothetical protein